VSVPYVDYRIAPDGLGGGLQISDDFSAQRAREIAAILSVPLP
jgi:preprotein translocase subunit SecD